MTGTTRPSRRRAAAAKTDTGAPVQPEQTTTEEHLDPEKVNTTPNRVVVVMAEDAETKNFQKFTIPKDDPSGVVGTLYFPLGTTEAKVAFVRGDN